MCVFHNINNASYSYKVWIDKKDNQKTTYLLPSTAHPRHICNNIPYSLAYRLLRICWSRELLEHRLVELMDAFLDRGYRRKSVQAQIDKIKLLNREDALRKVCRERRPEDRVRFIIRYDPRLPDLSGILTRQWEILVEDEEMKQVFKAKPMVCYQRVQNLGEMLTRARLPPSRPQRPSRGPSKGFHPCKKPKCPVCEGMHNMNTISKVQCSSNKGDFLISSNLTCSSKNVIYCITCTRGGRVCPTHPQYIGETGQEVRARLREHRGTVIQPGQVHTTAPVGVHFRLPGHSLCDLQLIPIEKNNSKDTLVRKVCENI